jgi:hypothetical protein
MSEWTAQLDREMSLLSEATEQALSPGQLRTETVTDPPGIRVDGLFRCRPADLFELLTNYSGLPQHIHGLREAEILDSQGQDHLVRFTMKLPFPVGRITWTNRVVTRQIGESYGVSWTLAGGELRENRGRLVVAPHDENPALTRARYLVDVETNFRLPRSAERLASRWLVPRIVGHLRTVVES